MTVIDRIWSEDHLIKLEREIWLQVMAYQHRCDPTLVTAAQILASQKAARIIRAENIHDLEMVTKHDIMARLQEFAALSGHNRIHLGMTSADIVENTYLIRQRRSVLALGLDQYPEVKGWLGRQQFRGIRGPVGSDEDQLNLLGSEELVTGLNLTLCRHFQFPSVINAVAQCMPRSLDLELASLLVGTLETHRVVDRCVANGLLSMIAQQEFWFEGDVSTSVVRRYAWPMIFKVLEGSLIDVACPVG